MIPSEKTIDDAPPEMDSIQAQAWVKGYDSAVDGLREELRKRELLIVSARYLLLAARGPAGGPTSWKETVKRWLEKTKSYRV